MGVKPKIKILQTSEDLARSARDIFIKDSIRAINKNGVFNVAVSGGKTPVGFFQLLAAEANSALIDWKKVHLFWVDERFVPPDAEASNYKTAGVFFESVSIPAENIHRVAGECSNYAKAAADYEQVIRKVFNLKQGQIPQFDLIVLGMGADGHIGSLFPNSYALFDTNDLAAVVYFMDGDYDRITLTQPVLLAASHLVVLVSGVEKADIVKNIMTSPCDEIKYPAHALWPVLDKVTWLIDSQAAKYL